MVGTPISANLIGVFFMNNRLAATRASTDPASCPATVQRVGVLGAGLMGAGIATAQRGAGGQIKAALLVLIRSS